MYVYLCIILLCCSQYGIIDFFLQNIKCHEKFSIFPLNGILVIFKREEDFYIFLLKLVFLQNVLNGGN